MSCAWKSLGPLRTTRGIHYTSPPVENQASASDRKPELQARLICLFSNEILVQRDMLAGGNYVKNGLNTCLEIFARIQKRTRPGEHPEEVSVSLLGAWSGTHLVAKSSGHPPSCGEDSMARTRLRPKGKNKLRRKCDNCEMRFHSHFCLYLHLTVHSKVKAGWFQCGICRKRFERLVNYIKHRSRHGKGISFDILIMQNCR